jgi:hypothetical protein
MPPARTFPRTVRSGMHPGELLDAARRPPEARHHLVVDEQHTAAPVSRRAAARNPSGSGTVPQDAPDGSRITAATSPACNASARAPAVGGNDGHRIGGRAGQARRVRRSNGGSEPTAT